MCKERSITGSYKDFSKALMTINDHLKTKYSKNLPEKQEQNGINTTNNDKIKPISKVVNENENMEMTDAEKHNEDYIGYLNRINGKGQENRK